jgi:hypothetical protein
MNKPLFYTCYYLVVGAVLFGAGTFVYRLAFPAPIAERPAAVVALDLAYLKGQDDAKRGRRLTETMMVDLGMKPAERNAYRSAYEQTAYERK